MRPDPSGQVAGYLASNRNVIIADVYSFKTVYGELLQFSGYTIPFTVPAGFFDQHSINAGSNVTFALGPRFGRSKTNTKIGAQVDTLDLEMYVGANDQIGVLTWQTAFLMGVFDLATVEVGRLVCAPVTGGGVSIIGYVVWFQGLVGDAEFGRTVISVKINSTLTLLSTQYPRRLWQATCSHMFGDAMCQFDRQSMAVTVTGQSGSGQTAIVTGYSPNPSNLYNDGSIIGLSGANTGLKRTVSALVDGIAYLTAPYVYPVQVGDYFSMLPGCDRSLNMCQNVFNNLGHYGGQPYIPPQEFSI